jgi:hypothetical protein
VTGGLRKLRSVDINYVYTSNDIVRIILSRTVGWVEHVAQMEMKNAYKMLVENLEGNRQTRKMWPFTEGRY